MTGAIYVSQMSVGLSGYFHPIPYPVLRASPAPMPATMILFPREGAARKFAYKLKFKQFKTIFTDFLPVFSREQYFFQKYFGLLLLFCTIV
jgi:hypothetical protein